MTRNRLGRFAHVSRWNPVANRTMRKDSDGSYVSYKDYLDLLYKLRTERHRLIRASEIINQLKKGGDAVE